MQRPGFRLPVTCAEVEQSMIAYLENLAGVGATEAKLVEQTVGRTTIKSEALHALLGKGWIRRSGSGKNGDPYVYFLAEPQPAKPLEGGTMTNEPYPGVDAVEELPAPPVEAAPPGDSTSSSPPPMPPDAPVKVNGEFRIVTWKPKPPVRLAQCDRGTPIDTFVAAALHELDAAGDLHLTCWGHGHWGLQGLLQLLAKRGVYLVVVDERKESK